MIARPQIVALLAALVLVSAPAAAQKKPAVKQPAPVKKTVKAPPPVGKVSPAAKAGPAAIKKGADPFKRLKVVIPKDKLGVLRSVRARTKQEAEDRSRTGEIRVSISSKPQGAAVYYGGRLLGTTPMALKAKRGSTPLDVVIKKKGYMNLRTRVRRKVNRDYKYRLTPAKIR